MGLGGQHVAFTAYAPVVNFVLPELEFGTDRIFRQRKRKPEILEAEEETLPSKRKRVTVNYKETVTISKSKNKDKGETIKAVNKVREIVTGGKNNINVDIKSTNITVVTETKTDNKKARKADKKPDLREGDRSSNIAVIADAGNKKAKKEGKKSESSEERSGDKDKRGDSKKKSATKKSEVAAKTKKPAKSKNPKKK